MKLGPLGIGGIAQKKEHREGQLSLCQVGAERLSYLLFIADEVNAVIVDLVAVPSRFP